jgi:hypothetical protein
MRTLVISAALAATAALAFGAGAASAKSCGGAIIQDWYADSTIDGTYSAHCYREALSRVSDRMRMYSDLPEQLERGLRAALQRQATSGRLGTTHTITQPGRTPASHKSSGPIQRVLGELGPDRADSIPIPLMILAGVALLLIAAGATSVLVRRLNGRKNMP